MTVAERHHRCARGYEQQAAGNSAVSCNSCKESISCDNTQLRITDATAWSGTQTLPASGSGSELQKHHAESVERSCLTNKNGTAAQKLLSRDRGGFSVTCWAIPMCSAAAWLRSATVHDDRLQPAFNGLQVPQVDC